MALLFLSSSLRTRLGFAEAAVRLGGTPIDLPELRWDEGMSAPESLADALRVVTGMADVTVVRTPDRLAGAATDAAVAGHLLNAGDATGHPSQALVDAFAVERFRGPLTDQRIAICGDLTMRAVRSFIELLDRLPPRELVLISPPGRAAHGVGLSPELAARTSVREPGDYAGIDVLSMCGLPPGKGPDRLDAQARRPYVLGPDGLATLAPEAIVLSPLPIIDEISPDVLPDPRVVAFPQSDASVPVRMALLELLLRS